MSLIAVGIVCEKRLSLNDFKNLHKIIKEIVNKIVGG